MKKIIFTLVIVLLASCNTKITNDKLYKETDFFVESLESTYVSYGIVGGLDDQKITEDGMYQITPIGRLVNVKILVNVPSSDYDKLKKELKEHYKDDYRVRDVYICGAGTVMIDCRN
jgi:hypothetical protein